jgi:hypothetical protein
MAVKTPKKYDRITIYFDPDNEEHATVYKKIIRETDEHKKQRSTYIIRQLIKAELVDSEKVNEMMVQAIVEGIKPLLAEMQITAKPAEAEPEDPQKVLLENMEDIFGDTTF